MAQNGVFLNATLFSLVVHGAGAAFVVAKPTVIAPAAAASLHEIDLVAQPVPQEPIVAPEPISPEPEAPPPALPIAVRPLPLPAAPPPIAEPKPQPEDPYAGLQVSAPAEAGPILHAGEGDGPGAFANGNGKGGHGYVSKSGTGDGKAPAPLAPAVAQHAPKPTVDELPRELASPQPAYPLAAKRRRLEGTVRVKLHIDASGRVAQAQLVSVQGDDSFGRAALDGVRAWRFRPARAQGQPVDFWVTRVLTFRLPKRG